MNKFNETYLKIKKIISEEIINSPGQYFIDMDLDLINQKYCQDGVDFDFIKKNADNLNIEVISLDSSFKSIRLESDNKNRLKFLLSTFIDHEKYDEVCTFIRNGENEENELND